jgi:hypothetical protein
MRTGYRSIFHFEARGIFWKLGKKKILRGRQEYLRSLPQIFHKCVQSLFIQLRLRIIHKKHGVEAVDFFMDFHLRKIEGKQAGALLSCRSEINERFAFYVEFEVIAMRADRSVPGPLIIITSLIKTPTFPTVEK